MENVRSLPEPGRVRLEWKKDKTTITCWDCGAVLLVIPDNVGRVRLPYPLFCCGKLRLF